MVSRAARYRPGHTTAAGLGRAHQAARQAALAALADGQPCARCQARGVYHPLTRALVSRSRDGRRWVAPLLDLDDFPGRMFGGPQEKRLSYRFCNRSQGATMGNRARSAPRRGGETRGAGIPVSRTPTAYNRW